MIIASTAALGLLLVGLLAISMTPRRSGAPVAANSTLSSLRLPATTTMPTIVELPLVTPVGDEGWAVTTADALSDDDGSPVEVRLPGGEVVEAEVVDGSGDLTVVSLPNSAPTEPYQLAASPPAPTDTVVVAADEPIVVTLDELAHVDVDEATPVLDEDGRLLGLCTGESDEQWLLTVDTMPDDPTTTAAPKPSTTVRPSPTTTAPTATSTAPPESTTTSSSSTTTAVSTSTSVKSSHGASGGGSD